MANNPQTWQLQTLTTSGWRTIAQGDRQEISKKFQERILERGQRRILDSRGTQIAGISRGMG